MPDDMREQIPKVKQVVRALNIPEYEQEGFEADDAIATLVGQAEGFGFDTTILTGDLDMLQLVSEHTKLMVSLRGGIANTVAYDLAKIEERWGLRPEQMLDYKSLKGDPTDNIPGIPGVGEKTASKLIATWGTLDELYEHIDEVTPGEAARPARGAPRVRAREPRADAARARRRRDPGPDPRAGGGVRPPGGRPAVPRVRVPDADRPAAAARRGAARGRGRRDARAARGRVPGGPGRRARRRRPGRRPSDPGGSCSCRWTSTSSRAAARRAGEGQRRRDRRDLAGGRGARGGARGRDRRPARARSRRRSWTRAGSRSSRRTGVAALEPWLRDQPAVGTGLVVDDPRPLAGRAAVAGRRRRRRPGGRRRRRRRLDRPAPPAGGGRRPPRRARRQAAADRPVRRRPRGATPLTVDFDTQIAAYLVNAALRAQKIADVVGERLDLVLPPAAAGLPPVATAGLEALSSLAVRPSLEQALRDEGVDRLFAEVELPLIPILARMEAAGIAHRPGRARGARTRVRRRDLALRGRDLRRRRPRVHDRLAQAAGRHPVRRAGAAQGPPDEDRLLDGRVGARGAARRAPGDRADPRVADLHEAPLDLRRGAADADRARRPAAHAVPPGRGGDRAAVVVGPQPPEHPDPDAARPAHPARVRRRLARHDARRRRLQPDRAPDPRPRVAATSTSRDAFAREADIHRETAARVLRKDARGRHGRRAVDGQDGQLRARLRDERLRALVAGRDQPPGRAGVHQLLLRGVRRHQPLHAPHPRDGARGRATSRRCSAASGRSPSSRRANPSLRGRRRADGDQHADPGHGGRHREDRDDPDRPGAARRVVPVAGPALGPRRAAARGAARRGRPADPGPARGDGGRAAARRCRSRSR